MPDLMTFRHKRFKGLKIIEPFGPGTPDIIFTNSECATVDPREIKFLKARPDCFLARINDKDAKAEIRRLRELKMAAEHAADLEAKEEEIKKLKAELGKKKPVKPSKPNK